MAPSAATACLLLAGRQELLSIQGAAAVWQLSGTTTLTRALGTPPSAVCVQPTSCAVPRLDHHGALRPHQALFNMANAPTALHVPFAVRGLATQAAPAISSGQADSAVPESERDQAKDRKLGARGDTSTYDAGYVAPHPSMASHGVTGAQAPPDPGDCTKETGMPRAMVYDMAYLESVKPIHLPPKTLADRLGLLGVRILRRSFDMLTGYGPNMTEAKWLRRIIFLETVAGVPGMVGGMLRHLHSLRVMRRDKGWIHCLLEEAENERMHLITFMELRKPGPLFRAMVLLAQGVFFNAFFLAYLVWPQVCHAFVGYLEEEAVRTYTHALKDIDEGRVWQGVQAPPIAQSYWGLAPGASMRELILAVRADEACHSHVNHTLKAIKQDAANPFALGKSQLP